VPGIGGNIPSTGYVFTGDDYTMTFVKAGHDFGVGTSLVSMGDPIGTFANSLGRYSTTDYFNGTFENVTLQSSNTAIAPDIGTTYVQMDGLKWGARTTISHIRINNFRYGFDLVGDHSLIDHLTVAQNECGVYFNYQNARLYGDNDFNSLASVNNGIGAICVDNGAYMSGEFHGTTYANNSPYFVYKEPSLGVTVANTPNITAGVKIDYLFIEQLGNGLFQDDNVLSSGSYVDSNKLAGLGSTYIDRIELTGWLNAYEWTTGNRYRRATFDVQAMTDVKLNNLITGRSIAPIASSTSFVPVGIFEVNNTASMTVAGSLSSTLASTYPLFAMPTTASGYATIQHYEQVQLNDVGWTGVLAQVIIPTTYTGGIKAGDCIAIYNAPCGTTTGITDIPLGIAVDAGSTPASISSNAYSYAPIATSGGVAVNVGYTNVNQQYVFKVSTGMGPVAITNAGSGATAGTYTGIAATSGCTTEPVYTITATTVITAITQTSPGVGCTAPAVIPTTAVTGLTGAVLTPQWPAAAFTPATAATDMVYGTTMTGYSASGSYPLGTATFTLKLRGMGLR
jgi:hypothetical protein